MGGHARRGQAAPPVGRDSRQGLDDPVLWDIARAVHEADLHDERYDSPEAAGLDALMRGMSMLHDDETFLELAAKVYDGFYAYCKKIRELEDSVR
jgi:hypothetical protein